MDVSELEELESETKMRKHLMRCIFSSRGTRFSIHFRDDTQKNYTVFTDDHYAFVISAIYIYNNN